MTVVKERHGMVRKYDLLHLEVPTIYFLPLTWTLVHPITPESPLHDKTPEDLAKLQAEVLVLIKGFDEAFRQIVHARYSYRHDEFVWGAAFVPAFHISHRGDMVLDLSRISATEPHDFTGPV
jgi:inward rectifier potassium channel